LDPVRFDWTSEKISCAKNYSKLPI
jgi:hypothetical protein